MQRKWIFSRRAEDAASRSAVAAWDGNRFSPEEKAWFPSDELCRSEHEGGIPTHPPSSFIFFTGRFFLPIMHCCRKQGIPGLGDGPGGRHWRETSADEIVPTPLALERAHPPACPGSCRPATGVEALEARCGGGGGSGAVDCK